MYSVLIVDDEPLVRSELTRIVESRNDISRIETASDGVKAIETLVQGPVDVVFLDVNMPEMTGVEMLEALTRKNLQIPAIIFVTAYNQYATQAFDHHAMDYVMKPFSESRIHRALDVAIRRTHAERAAKLIATLPGLREIGKNQPRRMAIKVQNRILFIDPAEIMSVQAEGNYVLLQTANGSHVLRESMYEVEQKLSPFGFVRIHRSAIVNAAFVREVQPCYTGEYVLKLTNGKEFTVTRTYKKNLRLLITAGIGIDSFPSEGAQ